VTPGVLAIERAEALVRNLAAAVRSRGTSGRGASRAESTFRNLHNSLQDAIADHGPFRLAIQAGVLTHEGTALTGSVGVMAHFARLLETRNCAGLVFRAGLTEDSLKEVVGWLSERKLRPAPAPLFGIEIVAPHAAPSGADQHARTHVFTHHAAFRQPARIQKAAGRVLETFMAEAVAGRTPDHGEVVELSYWVADTALRYGAALAAPVQARREDPLTLEQSINVFLLSVVMLRPFANERRALARLVRAAFLHDVGKCMVPRAVLQKRNGITDGERRALERHTEYGAEIIQATGEADPLAIEVAYCHHMLDGGLGYPQPDLPIRPGPVSRVIQAADLCESTMARMAHREPADLVAVAEAAATTPGMVSGLDALSLLVGQLTFAPPGAEVELATGDRGIVVEVHPDDPKRPTVHVFLDAEGRALPEGYDFDLRDADADAPVREVVLKPVVAG